MKRAIKIMSVMLALTMSVLLLTSCREMIANIRVNMDRLSFNDSKIAEETMELFFTAINNNDKEAIKELFSEKALDDCVNADEQIDDLLNRFGGDIHSWKRGGLQTGESIEKGNRIKADIWVIYTFETTSEIYRVSMHIYPIDNEVPNNVGVYNVCIVEEEKHKGMLDGKIEIIKHPEMEEHPIIWIPDLPELED